MLYRKVKGIMFYRSVYSQTFIERCSKRWKDGPYQSFTGRGAVVCSADFAS